jgi:acyl-CoA synthetase (AMP-forming)/AMP-acid ligase II
MIMRSIYAGTELIVMVRFDLERFCQLIQSHKITFSYVAPPVLVGLAKAPLVAKYDLSSLRMLNSGAAPLTRELVEQMQKRGRLPIKQGYGLSETSPTTHIQPWDEWDKSIGSVGKMLPNLVAKFIDPDGKEVPVGSTGELCMKGPNVFSGYLNLPEVSKAAFTEDGYFKTGDIGHVDEKGDFYITDRVKELIKYKVGRFENMKTVTLIDSQGFQVAPAELEGLLLDHPKVDDAAVIGLQDEEQHTELPRAYLVVSPGVDKTEATKKEIADWLHQRVAGHKRLRGGVYFVDQIPKSQAGKILRRILKDEAVKEKAAPKAKL